MDIVPTGWQTAKGGAPLDVIDGTIMPRMGARGYFAEGCSAGSYTHEQYAALSLLGKRMQFTTDLSGAGCGCNAAFYLVSMRQNSDPSDCHDYYCDANKVCSVSCVEIDIMEANQFAWHSTLHTAHDHNGKVGGYGGGSGFNGPRDWTGVQYAPGGSCIDTGKPFNVSVSFPVDGQGSLQAMEVELLQDGRDCRLKTQIGNYSGMAELTEALRAGMTPVASYWSSDDMLWMDGKGSDGLGPCKSDHTAACGTAVRFSAFSISPLGSGASSSSTTGIRSNMIAPVPAPSVVAATPAPALIVPPTLAPLPTIPAWGTLPVGSLPGLITQPPFVTQPPQLPWPVISAGTATTTLSTLQVVGKVWSDRAGSRSTWPVNQTQGTHHWPAKEDW